MTPPRPYNPAHPSVYLDTSALGYAFDGAQVGARPELSQAGRLLGLIEEIADKGNLVVSSIHLVEILDRGDVRAARGMVAWIDSLPTVWARNSHHVRPEEDEYWLKVAAGHPCPTPVRVFAPSMLATFEGLSAADSADLLEAPTLVHAFDQLRRAPSLGQRIKNDALRTANAFNQNRAAFAPSSTPASDLARLNQRVLDNQRTDLRRRAYAAHERLTDRQDEEYLSRGKTLNDVVIPFQDLFYTDPRALPLSKIEGATSDKFIELAAKRTPGSNNFNALGSSFADEFHAIIGAAYCSLFTCDRLTGAGLTDVRRQLGLPSPIIFAGDFVAFDQELRLAWNNVR